MRFRRLVLVAVIFATPAVVVVSGSGCSSDESETGVTSSGTGGSTTSGTGGEGGSTSGTGGSTSGTGGSTSSAGEGGIAMPTDQAPCESHIYECGDLLDNDNDGLVDSQDPNCTGPCDNTEDSLYPDLPGMTGAPCMADCFWDAGNGSGNDDCYWDHHCDPLEVAPDYPPEGIECAYDANTAVGPLTCAEASQGQSEECLDFCVPLTPNGCDCFGCCELPPESGKFVWLQSTDENNVGTCTIEVMDNTDLCHPCTVVPGCYNGCGPCELCMGKTTLPPECFDPDGGTSGQCPPDVQACGLPGQDPCPQGFYCITGCCIAVPT